MDIHAEPAFAPNLYYDNAFEIDAAKILPGEYYVTKRDMVLVTVLGSCVAACIRDRISGIGGMNHFMLPEAGAEDAGLTGTAMRYGSYAMEMMINQLLKMGAKRNNLEAKLFGGASVLKGLTVVNVGERNADFAQRYLQREEIVIASHDLLDVYPRKVYFFPASGRVLVKRLLSMHNETIIERERDYRARINQEQIQGDIELFE